MGYMEKLAAEKKAVKALYDKGMENLTDDEANELKNRFEEAKRLQERVDLFKGVNDLNVDEAKPPGQGGSRRQDAGRPVRAGAEGRPDRHRHQGAPVRFQRVQGRDRHARGGHRHGGHRLRAGGHAGRHERRLAL